MTTTLGRFLVLTVGALAACDPTAAPAVAPPAAPEGGDVPVGPELLWAPTEGILLFPDDSAALVRGVPHADAPIDAVRAELLSFVAAHGGARADTPLALELSDKIDPASVASAVELVRMDDGMRVGLDVTLTLDGRGARLQPRVALDVGARYALVVRGGAGGLRGTDVAARASPSFACLLGLAGRAQSGSDDACAELAHDDAAAGAAKVATLSSLGDALSPTFDRLQAHGVPPETLLGLGAFTVTDGPMALLDEHTGPWPSDLALDAAGHTPLPAIDIDGLDVADLAAAVAMVPGFSTSARMRVPFSCVLDEAAPAPALYALDAVADTPEIVVEHVRSVDGRTAYLRRRPALDAATGYVLVANADTTCGGAPVRPSLDSALLRARGPLARSGRSTTALLTDAQAARLEPARAAVAPLLDALEARGQERARLALAVPFTTLDAAAFVDEHTAALTDRAVAPALANVMVATPWDRGVFAVMPNVDTVVSGSFASLELIDAQTLRRFPEGPVPSQVPFVLTVPPHGDAPIPVLLFGHGLTTTKELAYLMADRLAQEGFATLAIDLPFHGERSVCTADLHCALGQHCATDHTCREGDDAPGTLAVVDSLWPDGPEVPLATGAAYIVIDDLVASRDHVVQGTVDLTQALRLLESGALDATVPGMTLSRNDWSWFGVSLGGIYGATLAGLTTSIGSFALNVPGADFVVILEESSVISPMLAGSLARLGIARDSEEFAAYEDLAHLVLDPVDPLNLAPRATVRRPSGWSEKRLLIQAAESDRVIPNEATHILATVTGLAADEYTPLISNHIFFFDPASFEGARARDDAFGFLAARP